jgi:hypothetical protein
MGLDMYLYKRSYVSQGEWIKEEHREVISATKGGKDHPTIKSERVKYITQEIGYWRKANAIHKWLVDNVQKGNDDCKEYVVFPNQLQKLKGLCLEIIEDGNKAPELLPTTNGFFFGGTEYDEYYFDDLHETVKIIDEALSDPDGDYYYSSSW